MIRLPRGEKEKISLPLDLDLGAVGKGYALDSALAVLREWDVTSALLHAGTSTALAAGPGPARTGAGRGWPVGAGSLAGASGGPGRVFLLDRAMSGSGTEVKGEHIVDPRTGGPARGHIAAWASHPSAAAADALSTAFMVMAADGVAAFCGRHPQVWALVINARKKCKIFNAAGSATCRGPRSASRSCSRTRRSLKNPNRARSVLHSFAQDNHLHFHAADGSGYALVAAKVAELDRLNPQIASRLARSFDRWRKYDEGRQRHARAALESIAASPGLSPDVTEVVSRALG